MKLIFYLAVRENLLPLGVFPCFGNPKKGRTYTYNH